MFREGKPAEIEQRFDHGGVADGRAGLRILPRHQLAGHIVPDLQQHADPARRLQPRTGLRQFRPDPPDDASVPADHREAVDKISYELIGRNHDIYTVENKAGLAIVLSVEDHTVAGRVGPVPPTISLCT